MDTVAWAALGVSIISLLFGIIQWVWRYWAEWRLQRSGTAFWSKLIKDAEPRRVVLRPTMAYIHDGLHKRAFLTAIRSSDHNRTRASVWPDRDGEWQSWTAYFRRTKTGQVQVMLKSYRTEFLCYILPHVLPPGDRSLHLREIPQYTEQELEKFCFEVLVDGTDRDSNDTLDMWAPTLKKTPLKKITDSWLGCFCSERTPEESA
jgi:hypothetical protein